MNKSLRKILFGAAIVAGTAMTAYGASKAEEKVDWPLTIAHMLVFVGMVYIGQGEIKAIREDRKFQAGLRRTLGDAAYNDDNVNILHFDASDIQDGLQARETKIIVEDKQGNMHVAGTLNREFFEKISKNIMKKNQMQNQR